jgi:hypothetical protein
MKKISIFIFLLFSINISLKAQQSGTGIGIMLGEPSGLSIKKWLTSSTAFDAGVGWSFTENGSIHLHGDYLIHNFDLINASNKKVPVYFGLGVRIKMKGDTDTKGNSIGVRVPVGVAYPFTGSPFDAFIEVVPILDLSPDARLSFNGAIGVRYYFE